MSTGVLLTCGVMMPHNKVQQGTMRYNKAQQGATRYNKVQHTSAGWSHAAPRPIHLANAGVGTVKVAALPAGECAHLAVGGADRADTAAIQWDPGGATVDNCQRWVG